MNLEEVGRRIQAAVDVGLEEAAEEILAAADKVVPIDPDEALRKSGRVVTGKGKATVEYGRGKSSAYAIVQHERLDLAHDPGRKAKFLEGSVNHGAVLDAVADAVQKAIK